MASDFVDVSMSGYQETPNMNILLYRGWKKCFQATEERDDFTVGGQRVIRFIFFKEQLRKPKKQLCLHTHMWTYWIEKISGVSSRVLAEKAWKDVVGTDCIDDSVLLEETVR